MRLKVCGMRDTDNIRDLLSLQPDYMGIIFYDKSPRNAEGIIEEKVIKDFPESTRKVGVFVNASFDFIMDKVNRFGLDMLQLHGEEPVELVKELKAEGIKVIKVFGVDDDFDFAVLKPYKNEVDFFLFDTKSKQRGGTGVQFNWNKLEEYDQEVPFFLSGGISNESIKSLGQLKGLNIHAIDVNSKYELEPGLKNIEELKRLTTSLRGTKQSLDTEDRHGGKN